MVIRLAYQNYDLNSTVYSLILTRATKMHWIEEYNLSENKNGEW